jgi:DNA repair protein RadC
MKQTALLFDCAVLDHIIVTAHSYYSFADEGII